MPLANRATSLLREKPQLTGKPLPQKLRLKYLHKDDVIGQAESLELGGAMLGSTGYNGTAPMLLDQSSIALINDSQTIGQLNATSASIQQDAPSSLGQQALPSPSQPESTN